MFADIVSISSFCGQHVSAEIYIGDIPEDKTIPALAFPPPRVVDSPGNLASFRKTYTLVIKVFEDTDSKAFTAAERIADAIRHPRYRIPCLAEDGTATGEFIRIDKLDQQMGGTGEAHLTLEWTKQIGFERETYEKVNTLTVMERMKSDA